MTRITLFCILLIAVIASAESPQIALREDFDTLERWNERTFPNIDAHTGYTITEKDDTTFLTARSDASASALIYHETFNPYDYPILRWRWRVENIYPDADPDTKDGDDYALRIYVFFEYDPEKAPLLMRIQYGLAKRFYGEYPPWASVNYIWANQPPSRLFYDNPYTDRSKMFPLRGGEEHLGQWRQESVNVLDDYRRAFDEDPPRRASLAIMNDADNTGLAAVSHLDFIEVSAEPDRDNDNDQKKGSSP